MVIPFEGKKDLTTKSACNVSNCCVKGEKGPISAESSAAATTTGTSVVTLALTHSN